MRNKFWWAVIRMVGGLLISGASVAAAYESTRKRRNGVIR